jgi:hypothetical protein
VRERGGHPAPRRRCGGRPSPSSGWGGCTAVVRDDGRAAAPPHIVKGRKGKRRGKKEGKREKWSEEIDCAAVPSPTPAYVAYFLQTAVPLVMDSGTRGLNHGVRGDGAPPKLLVWVRVSYITQTILYPFEKKKKHLWNF